MNKKWIVLLSVIAVVSWLNFIRVIFNQINQSLNVVDMRGKSGKTIIPLKKIDNDKYSSLTPMLLSKSVMLTNELSGIFSVPRTPVTDPFMPYYRKRIKTSKAQKLARADGKITHSLYLKGVSGSAGGYLAVIGDSSKANKTYLVKEGNMVGKLKVIKIKPGKVIMMNLWLDP